MKKLFTLLLAALLLVGVFAIAASAFSVTQDGTTYEVYSPKGISFSYHGSECQAVPQGAGVTIEALADGELVRDASTFSASGIILVKLCDVGERAAISKPVFIDPSEVPTFSFEMSYDKAVTFDAAYIAVYHEVAACIGSVGESKVIVETSKDGSVWTPVGEGIYYLNTRTNEYVDGAKDQGIDECVVPLGKEVSAQHVRYTFTFEEVPEEGYWQWYTNIYEWCGFTELGVAKYTSGKKPNVIDESQITAEPTKVEGEWISDDGVEVIVWKFVDDHGSRTVTMTTYDAEEYAEDCFTAEPVSEETATYTVLADKLTITYADGKYDEFKAVVDDDGDLLLGDLICNPYTAPEPPVEESSESPVEESSESPVEESSDSPVEESSEAVASEATSTPATSAATSEPAAEESGFPVWAIVLIVVAAVAVVAVVVIVIVRKKK